MHVDPTSPSSRGPAPAPGRDRLTLAIYVVLLVATAAAWTHVVWTTLADEMAGMDMAMPLTLADGLAFVVAWAIMMAAMMLPSALPMIALYARSGPMEVEAYLMGHPAINLVAVVGVPDPRLSEVGVAFVRCEPGHQVTAAEVVAYCRGRIASFKIPATSSSSTTFR